MDKCDICSERAANIVWRVNSYAIMRCPNCELVYADVNEGDIVNAYEVDYYKSVYPDYESDRNIHELNNIKLLQEIEKIHNSGSLIEIGSAFGFFLEVAERQGWKTCGYEISDYASFIARDKYHQNVKTESFLTADIDEHADMVCMFDTIEHLIKPSQYIEKIARVLKNKGGLVITTGDLSSLLARVCRQRWRMVVPPLHIYYYSRRTITNLLEQYGFRVLSISSESKYQNLNSIFKYQFRINKRFLPKIPIPVNLGDVMLVKAIKADIM